MTLELSMLKWEFWLKLLRFLSKVRFLFQHPSQHAMIPMSNEQLDLTNTLNAAGQPSQSAVNTGDHCPKHGKNDHDGNGGANTKESPTQTTSISHHGVEAASSGGPHSILAPSMQNPAEAGNAKNTKNGKKQDPKEIMKKRRERAICIDRVSRVIFPSTFILLNIIYWLVFSEILDAIKYSVGGDEDKGHK